MFFFSLSLSKKHIYFFIRVAYFNHAANLYWITEEKKKVTLNRFINVLIGQNSYRSVNG